MSNFNCEICGTACYDTPHGYVTGCEHYPLVPQARWWFTADQHFNHEDIIGHCGRPFRSLDEMNAALVAAWNAVVGRGDVVYCLGDFALTWNVHRDIGMVQSLLAELNGTKQLICGNHDRDAVKRAKGWSWVGDYKRVRIHGKPIVLFHYPLRTWQGSTKGAWHLHGHCHGNLPDVGGKVLDIGVDCWGFRPLSFEEVASIMATRPSGIAYPELPDDGCSD